MKDTLSTVQSRLGLRMRLEICEKLQSADMEFLSSLDGMLLPPLCAQANYVQMAKDAGLNVFGEPKDISADVKATW